MFLDFGSNSFSNLYSFILNNDFPFLVHTMKIIHFWNSVVLTCPTYDDEEDEKIQSIAKLTICDEKKMELEMFSQNDAEYLFQLNLLLFPNRVFFKLKNENEKKIFFFKCECTLTNFWRNANLKWRNHTFAWFFLSVFH